MFVKNIALFLVTPSWKKHVCAHFKSRRIIQNEDFLIYVKLLHPQYKVVCGNATLAIQPREVSSLHFYHILLHISRVSPACLLHALVYFSPCYRLTLASFLPHSRLHLFSLDWKWELEWINWIRWAPVNTTTRATGKARKEPYCIVSANNDVWLQSRSQSIPEHKHCQFSLV